MKWPIEFLEFTYVDICFFSPIFSVDVCNLWSS